MSDQTESQLHKGYFNLIDYYCSCIENMNRRYNLGHDTIGIISSFTIMKNNNQNKKYSLFLSKIT